MCPGETSGEKDEEAQSGLPASEIPIIPHGKDWGSPQERCGCTGCSLVSPAWASDTLSQEDGQIIKDKCKRVNLICRRVVRGLKE